MATADWVELHDRYYRFVFWFGAQTVRGSLIGYPCLVLNLSRKRDVYEMLWNDVDLFKYTVAASSFGGPIGEYMQRLCRHVVTFTHLTLGLRTVQPWFETARSC